VPPERIRRKLTLRAGDRSLVLVKGPNESLEHVLTKACVWSLYLGAYPDLKVETRIGDRFKPDLVSLDERGQPRFWAEAGAVSPAKITSLARRFRETHFAIAKWTRHLDPHAQVIRRALRGVRRSGPFELLGLDGGRLGEFVDERGQVHVPETEVVRLAL
jgi:hypothetical protein